MNNKIINKKNIIIIVLSIFLISIIVSIILRQSKKTNDLPWFIKGTYVTNGKGINIPLGATINYDPYTDIDQVKENKEVIAEKDKTGDTIDQIFKIENNEKQKLTWKVLGTDNEGNILIMPTQNITDASGNTQKLTLANIQGMKNGEEILNSICGIYGYGKGAKLARSIKVEDIDKLTGFDKTTYNKDYIDGYGQTVTYTKNDENSVDITWSKNKFSKDYLIFLKPDGNFLENKGDSITIENTFYNYRLSEYKTKIGNEVYDLITKDTDDITDPDFIIGNHYWLGDSWIQTLPNYNIYYGIFSLSNSEISGDSLDDSVNHSKRCSNGVRPVVSLKPDILVEEENGVWNIL